MTLDLDQKEMRRLGYLVTDLVAEHLASLREQPAQRAISREEAERLIAGPPPEEGSDFETILATLRERVFPYHAREPHPRFLGYVPSCPTYPAVLGDWMAVGYNFFAGVWPVATGPNEVELVVLDWFRQWLGLPKATRGLLTTGGSAATLTAVVAARHGRTGGRADRIPKLVLYTSDQAHSSVARAAWIAGIEREHVRTVATDDRFRMRLDVLEDAIRADRARGLEPFMVVANAGSTNTGAVDPLTDIADLSGHEGLWLHVDAAFAGFAALTDHGRKAVAGIHRADSVTLDPHKWLFVPFECGCLLARDPKLLESAFRIMPEYLKDVQEGHEEVNFADSGEQLTRYSRALKIWVSVQYYGLAAIHDALERGMKLAQYLEDNLRARGGFEILSPAQFGILCFRLRPAGVDDNAQLNGINQRANAYVNDTGRFLISSTSLKGTFSLRVCTHSFRTSERDLDELVDLILEASHRG
jgi:aromatic-L-amino-acid/L-tryptophan decarboxylase